MCYRYLNTRFLNTRFALTYFFKLSFNSSACTVSWDSMLWGIFFPRHFFFLSLSTEKEKINNPYKGLFLYLVYFWFSQRARICCLQSSKLQTACGFLSMITVDVILHSFFGDTKFLTDATDNSGGQKTTAE